MRYRKTWQRKNGKVSSGRIFIDGKGVGDVEAMVLRDRKRLGHDGIVLVLIAIEKLAGKVVSGPDIITRGFVFEDASPELINDLNSLVSDTLNGLDREIMSDSSLIKAKIRSVLKKYLRNTMEKTPMIVPIIFEV